MAYFFWIQQAKRDSKIINMAHFTKPFTIIHRPV
nr:MAG TPA: hypothetical protein [Inoviridae sp.]